MNSIQIIEVGPRDGLQNEDSIVSSKDKIKYIELLKKSGLTYIEATSFVRADTIPQLADASAVMNGIRKSDDVVYAALVPNIKGMEMALESGVKEVSIFTAASESFTKKNINATIKESLSRIKDVVQVAIKNNVKVRGYISTVVECPYEGKIKPESVLDITKEILDLGIYQVSLGETIGVAVPNDISVLLDLLCAQVEPTQFAGHFHDTRGTALVNIYKALEYGLRTFDSASAGLGGCPYAPGSAGNLATEDLVYALTRSGFDTGVDLTKLQKASTFVLKKLNRRSSSRVYNLKKD